MNFSAFYTPPSPSPKTLTLIASLLRSLTKSSQHYSSTLGNLLLCFYVYVYSAASCIQMQGFAARLENPYSVSMCKVSRPSSALNVGQHLDFNHRCACCKSAISIVTLLNSTTQANCKLIR
jgi:hypothetical protein